MTEGTLSLQNRVVLVVDDNPDICWALDRLLTKLGAECIRACDGHSALQAVQNHRLVLTLVDAKLPDMDGLDLAGKIRSSDPGIRVIVVSGYFYKDDPAIQAALEQGLICGFVEKPFLHAEIVAALEAALGSPDPAPGAEHSAGC